MSIARPAKRILETGERAASPSPKRAKTSDTHRRVEDRYIKIATFENANRVREDPPVIRLQQAVRDAKAEKVTDPGRCVVYWMRMQDMRGKLYLWREYPAVDINTLQLRTTVQLPLLRHMQRNKRSL